MTTTLGFAPRRGVPASHQSGVIMISLGHSAAALGGGRNPTSLRIVLLHQVLHDHEVRLTFALPTLFAVLAVHSDDDYDKGYVEDAENDQLVHDHSLAFRLMLLVMFFLQHVLKRMWLGQCECYCFAVYSHLIFLILFLSK